MPHFDFCVVGAGSAGFNAALRARNLGKSVVILEQDGDLAGLCILRGCMPAKTVLRSAQIAHEVEEANTFGIETQAAKVHPKAIVQRKRRLVREFAEDRVREIEEFPLYRGQARFISESEMQIGETRITAERFLISTGSLVVAPEIEGLAECGYMTSDDALEMSTLPKSMLVLGGGPVGCEFAQYFARLGVKVVLLQNSGELLLNEDPDCGSAVREALQSDGVEVVLGTTFQGAARCNGRRQVNVEVDGARRDFEADTIFLAMNRRPNIEKLNLEGAGVRFDVRGIIVDDYLRTSNLRVYAAGDVLGRRMLVHLAEFAGRLAAGNAFSDAPRVVDFDLHEAHSIYTQPEVAVAGLSEFQCRDRGVTYEAARYPFSEHGRAITMNLPEGFVKMLAAPDGTILGITIVGGDASDFIHEAIALIHFKAKVYDVGNMPHLHPTMAEIVTYPAEELVRRLGMQSQLICGAR